MIDTKIRTIARISFFIVCLMIPSCLLPPSSTVATENYKRPVDIHNQVKIHTNQVGYHTNGPKRAVVETVDKSSLFKVLHGESKKVIFEGRLIEVDDFEEWGGGPYFYIADFSDLKEQGPMLLSVEGRVSKSFTVSSRELFTQTFDGVISYFNSSRADEPDVWEADKNVLLYGSPARRDVRGGWYDASGDLSKYLSHLSYANYMNPQQTPLVAWALAWVKDVTSDGLLNTQVSEKVREEAVWGADYLMRVLDESGFFYINVFDHWSGVMGDRRICAYEGRQGTMTKEWHAAYREGGGMSIAALARISRWGVDGYFTSEDYLHGAMQAYDHLEKHNTEYADNGEENVIDDYTALLAASELYGATKDDSYLKGARKRMISLKHRMHEEGYFIADGIERPFWHASDAGLPVVALVRYVELETDESHRQEAKEIIKKQLSYQLEVTNQVPNPFGYARQHFTFENKIMNGFFIPQENESNYWWQGENARLGSLAAAAILGGKVVYGDTDNPLELTQFAFDQLNWILGANPIGMCFLKGFGHVNPPEYTHSKPQHSDLVGGISNGITGADRDGSGIGWYELPGRKVNHRDRWRWLEQWLPHSAWYMVAITAASL